MLQTEEAEEKRAARLAPPLSLLFSILAQTVLSPSGEAKKCEVDSQIEASQ